MYLREREVIDLAAQVRRIANQVVFVFTFMHRRSDGSPLFDRTGLLARLWLAHHGASFKWASDSAAVSGLIRAAGWQNARLLEPADEKLGSARGEWIAIAT